MMTNRNFVRVCAELNFVKKKLWLHWIFFLFLNFNQKCIGMLQLLCNCYLILMLITIYFQVQFIFFVKRKSNSTIEQQKCNEKFDRHLVSKVEFNFQISQRKKSIYWSSFSTWFYFIKKLPAVKCFRNSESSKGIFFLESREENKSVFFFCLHAFIDFFPSVCWLCLIFYW